MLFLLQLRRQLLIDREVRQLALRRDAEGVRHLDHHVGRPSGWMGPSVRELRQPRRERRVAFRRAGVGPGRDGLDLLGRQAPVVAERAIAAVGAPRRHLAPEHLVLDGARPRAHLAIGRQAHRGDLAGPMTGRAIVEHDGRDVRVEGGGPRDSARGRRPGLRADAGRQGEDEKRRAEDQREGSHLGLLVGGPLQSAHPSARNGTCKESWRRPGCRRCGSGRAGDLPPSCACTRGRGRCRGSGSSGSGPATRARRSGCRTGRCW